jgi:peptidoglycan hydrolase-like protein with peptidoglycan-binding domain
LHAMCVMKRLLFLLLLLPLGSLASGVHPEEDHPDPVGQASADPYTGFVSQVQEKLRELGFDAGPVNGDFGTKTQAALAQFQLSRTIPAGGQLDDLTLQELGVHRQQAEAAAGGTATDGSTTEGTATGG